jgi:hypothetical protein
MASRYLRQVAQQYALIAAVLFIAIPACSQSPTTEPTGSVCLESPINSSLLNSERIENCFGNYGIDVLNSPLAEWVVNLYSTHGSHKTLRTFAVTRFYTDILPEFSPAMDKIRVGGSIGATLKSEGWNVEKRTRYVGDIPSGARFVKLADQDLSAVGKPVAFHVYDLPAVSGSRQIPFATITEVHHPGYLGVEDLRQIYGNVQDDGLFTRSLVTSAMADQD